VNSDTSVIEAGVPAARANEQLPAVKSYRDLRVWSASIDLAAECYTLTKTFPTSELYGLTSQIRRAATSVPANIAEGYGRGTRPGFVQFLRIAQGSLKELETHLIVAERVEIISSALLAGILQKTDEAGAMLYSLIHKLQAKSELRE
jgi:four helix bundle protein